MRISDWSSDVCFSDLSGAQKYVVYKEANGIFGLIGESESTSFTDNNIQADTSVSHPRARNPFLGEGNYPGCTGYYEQRRVYGGSLNKPDTSYYRSEEPRVGNKSVIKRSNHWSP